MEYRLVVYHVPTGKEFIGKYQEQTMEEVGEGHKQFEEMARMIGKGEVTHMVLDGQSDKKIYIPGTLLKDCILRTESNKRA